MSDTITTPASTPRSSRPQAPATLIDITSRAWKRDPFPEYARLRREQPVCKAKTGQSEIWLVTRYDDVLAVLKDDIHFINNPSRVQSAGRHGRGLENAPGFLKPLAANMLVVDDPDHARLRGLVHKAFTPQRIDQMQGRMVAICNELIDGMVQKGLRGRKIDLITDFALPLPLTVITELLGVPPEDRQKFHRWTSPMLLPPTALNHYRMLPAIWFFFRYLRQTFAKRRSDPRDDLLTALLQAEEAGDQMSEDELLAMVFLLLLAGHETTVNLIASGTLALLQFPDQLALLRQDPTLNRSAVEELLRYTSPAETASERYALKDLTLQGAAIQRGEQVLVALASANRDESVFPDPDTLDIRRQKNKHLAFGQGIHYCVGAPLARMEGAIAFNLLAQRLPKLRLAVPADQLKWRASDTVRGLEALPVQI